MAVRVRVQGEWIEHAEGETASISDGHLHVTRWSGSDQANVPVAIYAPDVWKRVEVLEPKASG